mgnify:CR=1 FL=1
MANGKIDYDKLDKLAQTEGIGYIANGRVNYDQLNQIAQSEGLNYKPNGKVDYDKLKDLSNNTNYNPTTSINYGNMQNAIEITESSVNRPRINPNDMTENAANKIASPWNNYTNRFVADESKKNNNYDGNMTDSSNYKNMYSTTNLNSSSELKSKNFLQDVYTEEEFEKSKAKADNTEYKNYQYKTMDDGGYSKEAYSSEITSADAKHISLNNEDMYSSLFHSKGLFKRSEIDYFNKRYRFGILNPYQQMSSCIEYLFFTKPDLNIFPRDNKTGIPATEMHSYLKSQPYWLELVQNNYDVIKCLQSSLDGNPRDKFNHLLANMVQSNLDIPGLSADMIETPNNQYGVGYTYRGSSESGNDSFDFSLEFKDTKYLPVYHFFKAYEEYETIKHHGMITPYYKYIQDKVLYDQYSIYKFIVDEDGETIIYYCKFWGVKSKGLPRDVFSNTSFDGGISYTIDFNAAFFDDMNPAILSDFNKLSLSYYRSLPYRIDIYNHILGRTDNRPAKAALVCVETNDGNHPRAALAPGGKIYTLKWRGDDKY